MAQRTHSVSFSIEENVASRVHRVEETHEVGKVARAIVEASIPGYVDPGDLLGRPATIAAGPTGEEPRFFTGVVEEATCLRAGIVDGLVPATTYRVVVASRLAVLEQSWNSRIFQEMTADGIVAAVLEEHGLRVEKRLTASYATRTYTVQYQETALAFVSRLAEDDGFFLWRELDDEGVETIVLADTSSAAAPIAGDPVLPYLHGAGFGSGSDRVVSLRERAAVRPGTFTLGDYAFEKPDLDLAASASRPVRPDLEVYEYPGHHEDPAEGKRRARVRLEEAGVDLRQVEITSECHRLLPGRTLELVGTDDADGAWWILGVVHEYRDTPLDGVDDRARAVARLLPRDTPFRLARRTPRPRIEGPQTARVVAPAGSPIETIHTDAHARVKVKMPWDRSDVADDGASRWIRVAQLQSSGSLILPRVGWEVLVEYEHGDPDRPLVTGRLFNGETMPPYALPEGKTRTAIKTASTPGGQGRNEIRFEDRAGSEEIMIYAQKDAQIVTANDVKRDVGNNQTVFVGNDQTVEVGSTQTTKVTKGQKTQIGADQTVTVGGNRKLEVNALLGLNVGGSATTTVGGDQFEMDGNPLEALLALAAQKAAELAQSLADDAIAAVQAQVDGAVAQVLGPVDAMASQAQALGAAMDGLAGGDLGAVAPALAAAGALPTPAALGEAIGGGGGDGGAGAEGGGAGGEGGGGGPLTSAASAQTSALAGIAQAAAHQAIQQGVAAGAGAIGAALGLDAQGGGGSSSANVAGPEGNVAGFDATERAKGPGHSTKTIGGSHREETGSLAVLGTLQAIDTTIGGSATETVGAASVRVAVGDVVEQIGGSKTEKQVGLVVLTKAGESEKVGGSKTTMVGGAIVEKLGGSHSVEAGGPATFIGAFHKIEASGTITFKVGPSEVVIDGSGITITSPMTMILAPKIQAKKKVTEL